MVKNARDRAGRRQGRLRGQAPPATRCVECYTTFISALLDITDNDRRRATSCRPRTSCATTATTRTSSSPPTRARRRSRDIANGVAAEYGFWLGDAFASGGSVGYDHKAMGITARSAWVSVQRHFRELGVDVQSEDFTVVGIGDMSGDVFGNGMLLSPHIRLVAAFDHRHIFLDPDPDPARALAERQRLFELPRLVVGGLRHGADLRGRRRLPAHGQVDPAVAAGAGGAGRRGRAADADRADPGDPARARRPAVERRHRHLREGARRRRTPTSATRPTTRVRVNGARPARAGRRRGRQPRLHAARADRVRARAAGGSTPTRSTTPAASTAPTTRSTSRSCSTPSWPTAT